MHHLPKTLVYDKNCLGSAQVLIKGKITDKNGAGVIGASVALQDTRFGGFADLDGNYSFEAIVDPGLMYWWLPA
ncbi:MAG: hypothetical protein IPH16_12160 [Haliscomenobacter sp.]|nr:hypothetical protein [Haliscomenobacter sp.]